QRAAFASTQAALEAKIKGTLRFARAPSSALRAPSPAAGEGLGPPSCFPGRRQASLRRREKSGSGTPLPPLRLPEPARAPAPPILDPTPPPGSSLTRTPAPARPDTAEDALRRELYLFALYRTLEAALLALMVFSPFGGLIGEPRDPFLAKAVAVAYLPMALALLLATRRDHYSLGWQACLRVGVDIAVAALIAH